MELTKDTTRNSSTDKRRYFKDVTERKKPDLTPDFSFYSEKLKHLPDKEEMECMTNYNNHYLVSRIMLRALRGNLIFTGGKYCYIYRENKAIWQKLKSTEILSTVMMTLTTICKERHEELLVELREANSYKEKLDVENKIKNVLILKTKVGQTPYIKNVIAAGKEIMTTRKS